MQFDLCLIARKDGRAAMRTEISSFITVRFAVYPHCRLRENGCRVEERPMMLAAIQTVANANPERRTRSNNAQFAAPTTACELFHAAPLHTLRSVKDFGSLQTT